MRTERVVRLPPSPQPGLLGAWHLSGRVYFWPQHKWTGFQRSKNVPRRVCPRHLLGTPVPCHLIPAVLTGSISGGQLEEGRAGRLGPQGREGSAVPRLMDVFGFQTQPLAAGVSSDFGLGGSGGAAPQDDFFPHGRPVFAAGGGGLVGDVLQQGVEVAGPPAGVTSLLGGPFLASPTHHAFQPCCSREPQEPHLLH